MKKVTALILAFLSTFTLAKCDNTDSDKLTDFYYSYLSDCALPSGGKVRIASVEQEKDQYYTVLDVSLYMPSDENQYAWAANSLSSIKKDLRYIAAKFSDYAASKDMKSYYLYVSVTAPDFVYDSPADTLYYPKDRYAMMEMYEKFGTMLASDLEKDPDAVDFLVENGFATTLHDRIQMSTPTIYYNVYIENGEIQDCGFENSLKY